MNDRTDIGTAGTEAGHEDWASKPFTLLDLERMFATPVLRYTISNADQLNQRLVEDIAAIRAAAPAGLQISNQHGWHSENDLFRREEPSIRYLCECLGRMVLNATKEIAPRIDLDAFRLQIAGWINVNERGAYNTPHEHPGYTWSGSYYVRVPAHVEGRSGDLEFLDPRSNVQALGVPGSPFHSTTVRLTPREGTAILFPSYLRHWVYPNESDEQRISIAFNARLVERSARG